MKREVFSLFVIVSILSLSSGVFAEPPAGAAPGAHVPDMKAAPRPLFPGIYFTENADALKSRSQAMPYSVPGEAEAASVDNAQDDLPLLLNNDILCYYGNPNSKNMGILGRYPIDELDAKLTELAGEYAKASGGRGIKKAFYLIYGTVWPKGDIGILKDETVMKYIDYAREHDMLVFIDHQIGRFDPETAMKKLLPWLRYPNVHLALDPEWRTDKPMQEIGSVTAGELNHAQQIMQDYMIENNIAGERLLVVHQFNWRMIRGREKVRADFEKVRLVHCADGFGHPKLKKDTYAYNAQAANMPIKGFKLFYNFGIAGAGYDNPLLSPEEVYALTPRPYIIMYQ